MKQVHFIERLSLRDKFSALARAVIYLNPKKPFEYFTLKRKLREHHDINVRHPMSVRIKTIAYKARKKQQETSKLSNTAHRKNTRIWNTTIVRAPKAPRHAHVK